VDEFDIVFNVEALRWVNEHPSRDALVMAYSDRAVEAEVTFVTCGSVGAAEAMSSPR